MGKVQLITIFITVILIWFVYCGTEDNGTSCIGRSKLPGFCKFQDECTSKVSLSFNKNLLAVKCGFSNLRPIVCCENDEGTENFYTELEKQTKRYRKCEEYQSAIYTTQSVLQLASISKPVEKTVDQCGIISVPLIAGGTAAKLHEFPHSALLGTRNKSAGSKIKWICGGSLISRRFVLTAAHCLSHPEFGSIEVVRLGDLDYLTDKDGATPVDYDIAEKIAHPDYNMSRYNDIALLKLDRSVTINPNIRPLCLPVKSETPSKGIATGWGAVSWMGNSSNVLLKVTLESFSQSECNASYTLPIQRKLPNGVISSQMCAGSRSPDKDTCQGDSGGPYQIYHPTIYCMYIQVGVTSVGNACGIVNVPGIYTRLSSYVDWIENIVWPDEIKGLINT